MSDAPSELFMVIYSTAWLLLSIRPEYRQKGKIPLGQIQCLTWEPLAGFSSLAAATLSSRPRHRSDNLEERLYAQTHMHKRTAVVSHNMSIAFGASWGSICFFIQPTVPFFDDSEGLKLQLHVLLDHQGSKHLKVVCSKDWLEHRLEERTYTRSLKKKTSAFICNNDWVELLLGREKHSFNISSRQQ